MAETRTVTLTHADLMLIARTFAFLIRQRYAPIGSPAYDAYIKLLEKLDG